MTLAVGFVFFIAAAITLSPAARVLSWDVDYRWEHWTGFFGWAAGFLLLNRYSRRLLPDADPFLIPVIGVLTGWGLMMIWRLNPLLGARQTLWLLIGLGIFGAGLRYANILEILRRYKYIWLISGILVTALTYFFGTYPGGVGPKLWLGCCGIYIQPSEPLKLLLVVYLASALSDRLPTSFNLIHLLAPSIIMAGMGLVMVIGQQDLGTASLLVVIYTLTVYLSSGRLRVLLITLPLLAAAGWIGYQQFNVVQTRVDAWLNPWIDPSGKSYQIIQSLIGISAGGLFGSGAGLGSPGVVPVAHSDFVYAAIAEEFGLLGSLGFLALYGLLVSRGFLASIKATDSYRRILVAGLTLALIVQAILISGGNVRLLPLTGVTLPLVSYGGSSLVTGLIAVLLIFLVSNATELEPAPLPASTPYVFTSAVLLTGLFSLSLVTGYWAILRSENLLLRTDNPRRSIADRYSRRGSFLDHNNQLIVTTLGEPGSLERKHLYPPLSTTTGYSSTMYGQSGLEQSMDGYLRGTTGNPPLLTWWNNLLNSQPPPGLNVRLSIDLDLQKTADQLMTGHKGAAVLLNARTGEILVLASHPYFDPNSLEQDWQTITRDPASPLVNRATQSRYSPGTALGPFLLTLFQTTAQLPDLPGNMHYTRSGVELRCAVPLPSGQTPTWSAAISNGCPSASMQIGSMLLPAQLQNLYQKLGFFEAPSIPIPVSPANPRISIQQTDLAAIGEMNLYLTPLQMALATAAITTNGVRPEPILTTAIQSQQEIWSVLAPQVSQQSIQPNQAALARQILTQPNSSYWQTVALAESASTTLTWFLAGTMPTSSEVPLSLVLVLEEDNPILIQQIGKALIGLPVGIR